MVQDLQSHSKLLDICNPCRTTFNMLQRQTDNTGQMTALGRVMLIFMSLKSPASTTTRTIFHHTFFKQSRIQYNELFEPWDWCQFRGGGGARVRKPQPALNSSAGGGRITKPLTASKHRTQFFLIWP